MATRHVIGLASGPTLSGIDAALLEVEGLGSDLRARVVHWLSPPFSRDHCELLSRLHQASRMDLRVLGVAQRVLGENLASAARSVADQASVRLQQILCVGIDGLTLHQEGEGKLSSPVVVDAPAIVAERTGLTTISGFCWRDLAAGGQGGPCGALPAAVLFGHPQENRLVVHLGGISRVICLPPGGNRGKIVGWDAGPGSVLLEGLMQQISSGKERCDAGGKLAVQGCQIPELLEKWLLHPYLLRKPPKTLARSYFAEDFARQAVALAVQQGWNSRDLLCTANHLVARGIADSVQRFLPPGPAIDRIILTGSGVRNGLLWRLLADLFPGVPLERSEEAGVPAEASEAAFAALLACLHLDGVPASLPHVTGASGNRVLGHISPGSSANWSHCLAWMVGDHRGLIEELEE